MIPAESLEMKIIFLRDWRSSLIVTSSATIAVLSWQLICHSVEESS